MDPLMRVRDFLRDNVGHLAVPGHPSFDQGSRHWFIPVCCRTERGEVVVGDVEVDTDGRILYSPSREEMAARVTTAQAPRAAPV